nr:S9 family peptidase [Pseudenhygromyxa sp. WMMC2535]
MAWSPQGDRVAFLGAANINDSTAGIVHVVDAGGGEAQALTPTREATGAGLAWTSDEELLVLADQGTETVFWRLPAAGGEPTRVLADDPICHDFDLGGPARAPVVACAGDTATHPRELFAGTLRGKSLRRLSVSNADLLTRKLGEQSVVRWTAKDGLALEGILILPVGYQAGTRYPLAVLPHGGPEGVTLDGWGSRPTYPAQLFAARGYAVFMPNYRGSAGRGSSFAMADHQDLGGAEFEDVLAGIDHLVAEGIVDGERVGMGGWSYGGYFSALAATTYSDRFRAAMVAAGITDWISFTGTTEIEHENSLVHWKLWPWDDVELPWQRSPLAHIEGAKTPTLIVHGAADSRVPLGQSTELYRALLRLGVVTQLVVYPREGHGIRENVHGVDFSNRFLDWFDTHVKNRG